MHFPLDALDLLARERIVCASSPSGIRIAVMLSLSELGCVKPGSEIQVAIDVDLNRFLSGFLCFRLPEAEFR